MSSLTGAAMKVVVGAWAPVRRWMRRMSDWAPLEEFYGRPSGEQKRLLNPPPPPRPELDAA